MTNAKSKKLDVRNAFNTLKEKNGTKTIYCFWHTQKILLMKKFYGPTPPTSRWSVSYVDASGVDTVSYNLLIVFINHMFKIFYICFQNAKKHFNTDRKNVWEIPLTHCHFVAIYSARYCLLFRVLFSLLYWKSAHVLKIRLCAKWLHFRYFRQRRFYIVQIHGLTVYICTQMKWWFINIKTMKISFWLTSVY